MENQKTIKIAVSHSFKLSETAKAEQFIKSIAENSLSRATKGHNVEITATVIFTS